MNYALPAENDAEHICVTLSIPGDQDTISNFVGALNTLSLWFNYRKDLDKRGKDIAAVWKSIVQSITFTDCDVPPQPPRVIYIDDSEDEMSVCTQLRIQDGKLQGLCCFNPATCEMEWVDICGQEGGWIPDGIVQPGDGIRPPTGESKCYNVVLNANNQWLLPFGLNAGDTITFSNVSGSWSDGGGFWYCPDGSKFFAGVCIGGAFHDGSDPSASEYHMQVIAEINGAYYPANTGTITVPSGVAGDQMMIYANDSARSDNSGSLSLKVCVTNGGTPPPSEWCYVMDFRLSPFDFAEYCPGGGCRALYVDGVGWTANAGSGFQDLIQINSPGYDSTLWTSVQGIFTDAGDAGSTLYVSIPGNGGTEFTASDSGVTDPTCELGTGIAVESVFVNFDSQLGHGTHYTGALQKLIIRGTGANPFGSSNC